MMRFRSAAVVGAGTMGAQIAAHLANAGLPTLLLDVDSTTAAEGLKRARAAEARPVLHARGCQARSYRRLSMTSSARSNGATGSSRSSSSVSTSSSRSSRSSNAHRGPHAIVSSNTSGIPIARTRRGSLRGIPPPFSRHAFFQPAALPAPARSDPDCRHRPGRRRSAHVDSPIAGLARASSSRKTRRTSSPTASASSA